MRAETMHNQTFVLENVRTSGDSVILHGIDVVHHWCEEHKETEQDPIIPCMGPLMDALRQKPTHNEAQWLCEDRKWYTLKSDSINGG